MYNGTVAVDKPAGFTSFDVVAKLRGIFGTKKIGHTGTLDPMATGVLCICIGKATKAVEFLSGHDKTYRATMLLGRSTDTGDITGETTEEACLSVKTDSDGAKALVLPDGTIISDNKIKRIAKSFVGTYDQLPPMYSAKKIGGKRLYELAREGKTVERKSVPVTIYKIDIDEISFPYVTFTARVSGGTYIRTLCEDMARALGVPGTMSELRRIALGEIGIGDCYTLEELQRMKDEGALAGALTRTDDMFPYERVIVPAVLDVPLLNGAKMDVSEIGQPDLFSGRDGEKFLMYSSSGQFVGIHRVDDDVLRPVKMFFDL